MIAGQLLRAQHLLPVSKLLMHVKRVHESLAEEVDWKLSQSERILRQLILLVVEIGGDGSAMNVLGSPSIQALI